MAIFLGHSGEERSRDDHHLVVGWIRWETPYTQMGRAGELGTFGRGHCPQDLNLPSLEEFLHDIGEVGDMESEWNMLRALERCSCGSCGQRVKEPVMLVT